MKRQIAMLLVLLSALQLCSGLSLPAVQAVAEAKLSWQIEYSSYQDSTPPDDKIAGFLGFDRAMLAEDGVLDLTLTPVGEGRYQLQAEITAGEERLHLIGEGSYGFYQESPLLSGQFSAESERGDACQVSVFHYPADAQVQVTLQFGAGTTDNSLLFFGERYGNIEAILAQVTARKREQTKLPAAIWLDNQPLTLQPDPILQNDQVLVPVRQLLQTLGAKVGWDAATRSVTAVKDDVQLRLPVGSEQMILWGESMPLGAPVIQQEGVTYGPCAQLASLMGARVIVRPNGDISLISGKEHARHQGTVQLILLGPNHVIIQNDSKQDLPLGGWSLLSLADPNGPQEFRFPMDYTLPHGSLVQVLADPSVAADNCAVWQWTEPAENPAPAEVQLLLANVQTGSERLILSNCSQRDLYLGNWRLISIFGKPMLNLPEMYLAAGSTLTILGESGAPSALGEVRWPNLPAVEQAYQEEQAALAAAEAEQRQQMQAAYAPLQAALGIADDFHFYGLRDLKAGQLPPFVGNKVVTDALLLQEMRLLEPQLVVGDKMPAFWVHQSGHEAYFGSIKADGSMIAHRLQYVKDNGFVIWSGELVLPAPTVSQSWPDID